VPCVCVCRWVCAQGSTVAEAVQSAEAAAGTTPLVPKFMKAVLQDALKNKA
jgi:hypothetical protein